MYICKSIASSSTLYRVPITHTPVRNQSFLFHFFFPYVLSTNEQMYVYSLILSSLLDGHILQMIFAFITEQYILKMPFLCLFIDAQYSIVQMYHSLFSYFPTCGHLGCIQCFTFYEENFKGFPVKGFVPMSSGGILGKFQESVSNSTSNGALKVWYFKCYRLGTVCGGRASGLLGLLSDMQSIQSFHILNS